LQDEVKTVKMKNLTLKTSHKENKVASDKFYEFVDDTSDNLDTNVDELFFLTKKFKKMMKNI